MLIGWFGVAKLGLKRIKTGANLLDGTLVLQSQFLNHQTFTL
jgi:hypothetical protein